jgi:hypothetical protein
MNTNVYEVSTNSYSFVYTIALSLLAEETRSYTCAIVYTNEYEVSTSSYSFVMTITLSLLVEETRSYTCATVYTNVAITQLRL